MVSRSGKLLQEIANIPGDFTVSVKDSATGSGDSLTVKTSAKYMGRVAFWLEKNVSEVAYSIPCLSSYLHRQWKRDDVTHDKILDVIRRDYGPETKKIVENEHPRVVTAGLRCRTVVQMLSRAIELQGGDLPGTDNKKQGSANLVEKPMTVMKECGATIDRSVLSWPEVIGRSGNIGKIKSERQRSAEFAAMFEALTRKENAPKDSTFSNGIRGLAEQISHMPLENGDYTLQVGQKLYPANRLGCFDALFAAVKERGLTMRDHYGTIIHALTHELDSLPCEGQAMGPDISSSPRLQRFESIARECGSLDPLPPYRGFMEVDYRSLVKAELSKQAALFPDASGENVSSSQREKARRILEDVGIDSFSVGAEKTVSQAISQSSANISSTQDPTTEKWEKVISDARSIKDIENEKERADRFVEVFNALTVKDGGPSVSTFAIGMQFLAEQLSQMPSEHRDQFLQVGDNSFRLDQVGCFDAILAATKECTWFGGNACGAIILTLTNQLTSLPNGPEWAGRDGISSPRLECFKKMIQECNRMSGRLLAGMSLGLIDQANKFTDAGSDGNTSSQRADTYLQRDEALKLIRENGIHGNWKWRKDIGAWIGPGKSAN